MGVEENSFDKWAKKKNYDGKKEKASEQHSNIWD